MTFEDAWDVARDVEGWLTAGQARLLYERAGRVPAGQAVVEVGSHRGKSTILLAAGLRDGVQLVAVDPFDDPRWGGGPESLEVFEANLAAAGISERVSLFRGVSRDASMQWTGPPVGLAWIDGAHDRASVLADLDGWGPRLAEGATLLVHDAFSAVGTTEAVLLRLWWTRRYAYAGCERTLLEFRREPTSVLGALRDALRMSPRLAFFARMLAIKASRRHGMPGLERLMLRGADEPLI